MEILVLELHLVFRLNTKSIRGTKFHEDDVGLIFLGLCIYFADFLR